MRLYLIQSTLEYRPNSCEETASDPVQPSDMQWDKGCFEPKALILDGILLIGCRYNPDFQEV